MNRQLSQRIVWSVIHNLLIDPQETNNPLIMWELILA